MRDQYQLGRWARSHTPGDGADEDGAARLLVHQVGGARGVVGRRCGIVRHRIISVGTGVENCPSI